MSISETKLNTDSYFCEQTEFNHIREDREANNGGGVTIFIRKGIEYHRITLNHSPKGLEYNALKIVKENQELILVSVYNPPDNNLSYPQISKFFKELESFKKVIISGDLNAQHSAWGSDWNKGT